MIKTKFRATLLTYDFLLFVLLAWVVGSFLLYSTGLLMPLGQSIPFNQHQTDYFMTFLFQVFIFLGLYALPLPPQEKILLCLVWVLKCGAISILMAFYEFHYQIHDSYGYYSNGFDYKGYSRLIVGDGTHNMIVISGYLNQLGFSYFRLQNAMFSVVGLLAVYLFHRSFQQVFQSQSNIFLILACIFPSITFWSSILGKDPWTFFFVALLVFSVVHMKLQLSSLRWLLLLAGALSGIYYIRPWMVQIIVVALFLWGLVCAFLKLNRKIRVVSFAVLALLSLIFAQNVFKILVNTNSYEHLVRSTSSWNQGGSALVLDFDFYSIAGLLEFLLIGSFTALFRPLPGDVPGFFPLLSSLENLIFLFYCAICLPFFAKRLRDRRLLFLLILVVVWALIYSFVSYQNLGTAVRFRLQIMPVILLILAKDAEILYQRLLRRRSRYD